MASIGHLDVLIVGAGYGGLNQLYLLRDKGLKVKVVEATSRLGGVWYWNNYPGLRVDTMNPMYDLNIDEVNKDWTWSEKFSSRDEILRYLEHVDEVLGLKKDIEFDTTVISAEFQKDTNLWRVHTNKGDINTRFFILCVGPASKKYVPDIEGLDSFEGKWCHTSAWPKEGLDCKGKRVAVVGTGASGVQIIQELAPQSSHLIMFQRTPNMCLPMFQHSLDPSQQKKDFSDGTLSSILDERTTNFSGFNLYVKDKCWKEDTPEARRAFFEEIWAKGWFHFWVAGYKDTLIDEECNRAAYNFWAEKSRARIKDAKKRDLLAPLEPPHAFGTKRPCMEHHYFEVCDSPNVEIVNTKASPIHHITSSSIVTDDGAEHGPFDIIILATGYDTIRGSILNIKIRGKESITLEEKWEGGLKTYLGMTAFGFPNLFITYGVQSPTSFANGPPLLELQTKWVAKCILKLKEGGKKKIEAREEDEKKWSEMSVATVNASLFPKTDSWYMQTNIPGRKKEPLCFLGGLDVYAKKCDEVTTNYEGFVIE